VILHKVHVRDARHATDEMPAWKAMPMKTAMLRIATFVLLLLIVGGRAFDRLVFADLWAEDGPIFFNQAATVGNASLFVPYAGSYFLIERLIMLGAIRVVPLAWVPALVALSCVVVLAAVMSRVVSPAYEWLIPLWYLRLMLAVMFCFLPGLTEMTGNLCNLNWILFCWLALVGLKDPTVPLTWIELATSVLVAVSIGTTILVVPLFMWRLVVSKGRMPTSHWTRGILQLVALVLAGVVSLLFVHRTSGSALPSVLAVGRAWYDHVAFLVGFIPWLGDSLANALWSSFGANLYRVGKVLFLIFGLWWTWGHRHERRTQAIVILVLGMSFWTVLAAMVRPNVFDALHGQSFSYHRYSFPMSFAGILFWLVVLGPWATAHGIRKGIVFAFLVLNVTMSLHRFKIGAYGQEQRWQASVNALERSIVTGCPRTVPVRQYPDPWRFTYVSPRPAIDCAH
jgi:hypothetical protein